MGLSVQFDAANTIKTSVDTAKIELAALGDLTDVDLANVQDGDLLMYDASRNVWVAGTTPESAIIDGGTF